MSVDDQHVHANGDIPFLAGLLGGPLGGGATYYNLYPTATSWLAVAALEPQFWAKMQALLGLRAGTYDELKAILLTKPAEHWEAWAAEHHLPLAAVRGCPGP